MCPPVQIPGPLRLQAPEGRRAGAEEGGDVPRDGEVPGRLVQGHLAADRRLRCLPGELRHPRLQVTAHGTAAELFLLFVLRCCSLRFT